MPDWYVAKTKPHKERLAELNLANQGVRAFLPRHRTTRRRFNAFEDRLEPLFPGYIFFSSGKDPALWRAIGGTRGLQYVLWGDGRTPRPVPEAVMREIIAANETGTAGGDADGLAPGDAVTISRGPFTGFLARVRALDGRGRVELLLEAMGGVGLSMGLDGVRRC